VINLQHVCENVFKLDNTATEASLKLKPCLST